MAIKHIFQSAKADGGDATLVRPTNWNADHNHVPFSIPLLAADPVFPFTNTPSAVTEWVAPRMRSRADLTTGVDARIVMQQGVVGVTGRLRCEYSTDQTTWVQMGASAQVDVAFSTTANIAVTGAWTALATGAKADVWLRLVTSGGNATEDPTVWMAELQVR